MWRMVSLAVLAGCVVGGGELEVEFDDATGLSVDLSNGSVTVEPAVGDTTVIAWDGGGIGDAATPTIEQGPDGRIHVDATGGLGGGDIVASVVRGIPIRVLVERGDVEVELRAPADLDLCVAAGSISVEVPPGDYDLDVAVGAGSVDIELPDVDGAPNQIVVCAGAGDIEIAAVDD